MTDLLQQIRDMQFEDKRGAETLLLPFIRDTFPLDIIGVELRPLAISLNSFNGYLTLRDGKQYFFKSHTESNTVISEYYQAEIMAEAGYPVIQPIFSSTEPGKQLLIYELIESPSVFDVAWEIENGNHEHEKAMTEAQNRSDDELLALYRKTLAPISSQENAKASIHQLFYHRLTSGRLDEFYGLEKSILLPDGSHSMKQARNAKWIINGQRYDKTLEDLIQHAIEILNPNQDSISIIGHGDAHNGNVFYQKDASLLYFDPAFAGRHHPLLDLTKPLFHNVFAMWMYFPHEKQASTPLQLKIHDSIWQINYDYALPSIRKMFWESKVQRVLIPIIKDLSAKSLLQPNWRGFFKLALFCCPLLTMDLTDLQKFPSEISLLGLAMSVEMGAESYDKRSWIDEELDRVEQAIL